MASILSCFLLWGVQSLLCEAISSSRPPPTLPVLLLREVLSPAGRIVADLWPSLTNYSTMATLEAPCRTPQPQNHKAWVRVHMQINAHLLDTHSKKQWDPEQTQGNMQIAHTHTHTYCSSLSALQSHLIGASINLQWHQSRWPHHYNRKPPSLLLLTLPNTKIPSCSSNFIFSHLCLQKAERRKDTKVSFFHQSFS